MAMFMRKKSGKKKRNTNSNPCRNLCKKLLESGGLIPYIKKQKW